MLVCCDYSKRQLNTFLEGMFHLIIIAFLLSVLISFQVLRLAMQVHYLRFLRVRDGGLFVENFSYNEIDSIITAMST